jgi:L-seryl-tRNA(Ser) seleniumtransferase
LTLTAEEVERRAGLLVEQLVSNTTTLELLKGESAVGGGAAPTSQLPTTLVGITHASLSPQEVEHSLRTSSPPIIARISEGKVLLDLRTVFSDQEPALLEALKNL